MKRFACRFIMSALVLCISLVGPGCSPAPHEVPAMGAGNVKALDEQSFAQETGSGVSLVFFSADWCGPCRIIGPIIDQVAVEYADKALVAKVDVDACKNTAAKLGVNAVPTLVVFKDGAEMKRFLGVTTKGDLTKALDAAIGQPSPAFTA